MEVKDNFSPLKIFSNSHIQTILPRYFSSKKLSQFSEDIIYLELSTSKDDKIVLKHNFIPNQKKKNYYIVMIHGMEGCSESHYLLRLSYYALLRGFNVIRVNLRNCGSGLNLTKTTYHAGFTRDVEEILKYVYFNLSKNIILAGFSLSANTILKYFGEDRENYYAKFFSAVAPPLNLEKSCFFIDNHSISLYKNHFLKSLKLKIKRGYIKVEPSILEKIDSIKTMFDFDDLVVTSLFGYKTATQYYQKNSCEFFLSQIRHQGLILHSFDDPVVLVKDWLKQKVNSNLDMIFSKKGGHVGFCFDSYFFKNKCWLSETLLDYYESMI